MPTFVPLVPRSSWLTGALLGTLLFCAGCSNDINPHGNLPTTEALGQIQEGVHTRTDIQALLGTPSATSMFGGETWFYISNETTQVAFFKPKELERTIIAVHFDDNGRVKGIDHLSKDDGQQVDIVGRETPTRGNDSSIVQELFGNIGRFAPKTVD
ncbi:cell envelope protein SmpA [Rhodospirillum rubrum]|uniref:outer membrane protein assembly factor BamE n=1 Tax=Rhodospirillum rubrum TaxID=1085 RepID=UPI0019083F06|nr:outer membrane protein assembly factor BamE [Rhodospirillum rubrum]MBK1664766.1 cell envelope protein SmpA [Rhodospirillum rubrum]MBK1676426.1 cell envelope protein SmpA [Rhodospirillum rubrum]